VRVAHLRGASGGLNGGFKLVWGNTVKDDGAANILTGGQDVIAGDLDWFFMGALDKLQGFESGEKIINAP
jgi:hypothetical protein